MSRSTSIASSEVKELNLIGKVELRIALADTDAKLIEVIKTFLPPLLLKLASEHVNVRNKVISICQHINTRSQSPAVSLPIAVLLKQFKEHPTTPLIRNFDLLYIKQGIQRLPANEQAGIVPILLIGIANDAKISTQNGATLFNLLLRLLPYFPLPERGSMEDSKLRVHLGLMDRPEDVIFLAFWFGKLLLLAVNASESSEPVRRAHPGLSYAEYEFLTLFGKKTTWDQTDPAGLNLTETKITIAKVLASGLFTDQERFLPAVFASVDSNSRIADIGIDILKRTSPNISLENPVLVEQLFQIYCGDSSPNGPLPARPALKIHILRLLSKSVISTSFAANIIKLVQDGIVPPQVLERSRTSSSSSSGREVSKLRNAILSFITWTARVGSSADLQIMAPPLVQKLREYVEQQGWPNPNDEVRTSQELALRGFAYESIGLLAKASPRELLLDCDLDLLRWLFRSLSEDGSGGDMVASIEEALGSVLGPFTTTLDPDVEDQLRSLLLHHMTLDISEPADRTSSLIQVRRSTRFVAVRFANRCLRYNDIVARWIDLLAIGGQPGERDDVVEEGRKGLNPHWYQTLNPPSQVPSSSATIEDKDRVFAFPGFADLIQYIIPRITYSTSSTHNEVHNNLSLKKDTISILTPAVVFCRALLITQATACTKSAVSIDIDWERNLDSKVSTDELARTVLKDYVRRSSTLEEQENGKAILAFLQVVYEGMVWDHGEGLPRCAEYFIEVSALCSNAMVGDLAPHVTALKNSIWSNKHSTRINAAHTYGILASHTETPSGELQKLSTTFLGKALTWNLAIGADLNKVHGSIVALAFLWGRLKLRSRLRALPEKDLHTFYALIFDVVLESKQQILQEAAFTAIDQLCLFSVLLPAHIPSKFITSKIVDEMVLKAKTGSERAILALGHFTMIFEEGSMDDILNQSINGLYSLHEIRQADIHFAVGEALSCAASGWGSKSLMAVMDVDEPPPALAVREETLSNMMNMILHDCKSTKPTMRKVASAIWLLCIVQFNSHSQHVQGRLRHCQAAFKGFLADRDPLVQETASRGLALVYAKGDRVLKDDLVKDLVASFTSTDANLAGSVSEDTELFEPGALPTGEGSITTYKDIMSLASEVGDPSLVYRFMSLASHDAIWSSRAAFGRFGLDNILSDSSVDGYLAQHPKLYPKLYRYRFDPNIEVQRAMNDIWAALVKDPVTTTDKYFDEIMNDLLRSIFAKEWRVRQACCAAIGDLVQSKPFERVGTTISIEQSLIDFDGTIISFRLICQRMQYEKYLGKIWSSSFKVLDDIKLSVRTAAMSLVRVLTGILIRNLEVGESAGENASFMLERVIPFLLSPSGLEASAREVQTFALSTLLEIIKKSSGKHLRPFIPKLVESMLGLLSLLEPEAINYIHLNAASYNLTQGEIDEVRLTSVRGSPLMEAIERCLDHLDGPTMKELLPSMEAAMKGALGLPSKVGCSRVLVSLSTRHSFLFRPHGGYFLKLVQQFVLDRNETVSSAYCMACGHLARLASDIEVLAIVDFSKHLYFDSEDTRQRVVSAQINQAISKYSNDRFLALAKTFLPFIFVAKHDSVDQVKEPFSLIWDNNVGGSRAVLLYVEEIVALTKQYLTAPQWEIKQTASRAVANTILSYGKEINQASAVILWPVLNDALGGKTWEGKEKVLDAFVAFIQNAPHFWKSNARIASDMQKIILRESKRRNAGYRQYALLDLGLFAEAREDVDMFSEVFDIVVPTIEEQLRDEVEMQSKSGSRDQLLETISDTTIGNGMSALFRSINLNIVSRTDLKLRLSNMLRITKMASMTCRKIVQRAVIEGDKLLYDKMSKYPAILEDISLDEFDKLLFELLMVLYGDYMDSSEQNRQSRAEATLSLAKLLSIGASSMIPTIKQMITQSRAHERSTSVQRTLESALRSMEEGKKR